MIAPTTPALHSVVARAEGIAFACGDAAVSSTHLLAAIIADGSGGWARTMVERGSLDLRAACERMGWQRELVAADHSGAMTHVFRVSMRRTITVAIARFGHWLLARIKFSATVTIAVRERRHLDRSACQALEVAKRLAENGRRDRSETAVGVGHLALALASTPGQHLRLLDNATVVACGLRRKLRLDRWHHRLIARLDWPKMVVRRFEAWLARGVAARGRVSLHWPALLVLRGAGAVVALTLFLLFVPPTLALYVFLWPALLLVNGLRTAIARSGRCDVRLGRWYEIPGGEAYLPGEGPVPSGRLVAAVVLLPRLIGFGLCAACVALASWRVRELGLVMFPQLYTRPDLLVGPNAESGFLAPFEIFFDALANKEPAMGLGLLAGLGAGIIALPTYREIELVRLYSYHQVGRGARLVRFMLLPAALVAGVLACVEAVLPLRNGPLYVTVYVVPLFFAALVGAGVISLFVP